MAKLLVLFGLLALSVSAIPSTLSVPYELTGFAFCDYCRVGYEVKPVQPSAGSTVELRCTKDGEIKYSKMATTKEDGSYSITVERDCDDEICKVRVVSSLDSECNIPCPGRDEATAVLTSNNGIASNHRYANAVAFTRKSPLRSCPQLLQQYDDLESSD